MHFTIISQIYIVSSFVGMGFMVVSTLLGRIPRHGGGHGGGLHAHGSHGGGLHGGHGAHGGSAQHAGGSHGGTHSAIGHGSSAPGAAPGAGHNAGGHGAHAAHAGSNGHAANGAHSASAAHSANAAGGKAGHPGAASNGSHALNTGHGVAANASGGGNSLASTGPIVSEPSGIISRALGEVHGLHVELKEENLLEMILGFFNPLTMATFMTFFGLSGLGVSVGLHLPIIISLPVAIVCGWIAVQIVVHSIAWLFENLGSSTEAKVADFVGRMAEVSIPIDIGKTGEVIYVIGAKRYASAAKSLDPEITLTRNTKVMISAVQDHLVLVEPWTDSFIDPDFNYPKLHSGQP